MQQESKNRLVDLDIVCSVALIAVISGYFFTINTPYNDAAFEGKSMFFKVL